MQFLNNSLFNLSEWPLVIPEHISRGQKRWFFLFLDYLVSLVRSPRERLFLDRLSSAYWAFLHSSIFWNLWWTSWLWAVLFQWSMVFNTLQNLTKNFITFDWCWACNAIWDRPVLWYMYLGSYLGITWVHLTLRTELDLLSNIR